MITAVRNVRAERGFTPKDRFKLYVSGAERERERELLPRVRLSADRAGAPRRSARSNGEAPAGAHHDVVEGFAHRHRVPGESRHAGAARADAARDREEPRRSSASLDAKLANEQFVQQRARPAIVDRRAGARRRSCARALEKLQQNQWTLDALRTHDRHRQQLVAPTSAPSSRSR